MARSRRFGLGFYARNRIYFAVVCGALSTLSMIVQGGSAWFCAVWFVGASLFLLSAAYLIDQRRGRMDD